MSEKLYNYVMDHNIPLHPVLEELEKFTAKRNDKNMQISKDQGVFLYNCVRMMNAKRVLEVGTFTGYSAICMALALEEGAELISVDMDSKTQEIAKNFMSQVTQANQVRFVNGKASEQLDNLLSSQAEASFDFIFIDADKENYAVYYEKALKLLRTGGYIAADSVIWDGRVIDSPEDAESTR